MSKKKLNKLNKKRILIIIVVVFIIIGLLIIIQKNRNSYITNEQPNRGDIANNIDEYIDKKVIPQGVYNLYKDYGGEVSRDEIYSQLYIVTQYIPKICNDFKTNLDANEYFEKNKDEINTNLGITTSSEFQELIEYLKDKNLANKTLEYCKYSSDALVKGHEYWIGKFSFKYQDTDLIELTVGIKSRSTDDITTLKVTK